MFLVVGDERGLSIQGNAGDLQVQIADHCASFAGDARHLKLRFELAEAPGRPLVVRQDGQDCQEHIQPRQVVRGTLRFGRTMHQFTNADRGDRQLFVWSDAGE